MPVMSSFVHALQTVYPRKVKRMFLEKWSNSNETNKCVRQIKQYAEDVRPKFRIHHLNAELALHVILHPLFHGDVPTAYVKIVE